MCDWGEIEDCLCVCVLKSNDVCILRYICNKCYCRIRVWSACLLITFGKVLKQTKNLVQFVCYKIELANQHSTTSILKAYLLTAAHINIQCKSVWISKVYFFHYLCSRGPLSKGFIWKRSIILICRPALILFYKDKVVVYRCSVVIIVDLLTRGSSYIPYALSPLRSNLIVLTACLEKLCYWGVS